MGPPSAFSQVHSLGHKTGHRDTADDTAPGRTLPRIAIASSSPGLREMPSASLRGCDEGATCMRLFPAARAQSARGSRTQLALGGCFPVVGSTGSGVSWRTNSRAPYPHLTSASP